MHGFGLHARVGQEIDCGKRDVRLYSQGRSAGPRSRGLSFLVFASLEARLDKSAEQGMCLGRLRFEFGMTLHRHKPGMISQFHDFHQFTSWAGARDQKSMGGELLAVLIVKLIAMTMAL